MNTRLLPPRWSAALLGSWLALSATMCSAQHSWPEFRGPQGNGQAIGAELPTDVGDPDNVKWKTGIHGKGWSSPVVWDDQIWLTTATEDGKQMSALCVDLNTGRVLRDQVIHRNESPAFSHPTNSYATPTPAIEAGRVYLHFGCYGTTCLDTRTGKTIWQRTDFECNHHRGPASSPILYQNMLIVAFDGFDVQYVVALDKSTGKTLWKSNREIDYGTTNGDRMKAYCTGSVFSINGKAVLVYPSAVATVGYDVSNGQPLWTVYHGGMNASARPLRSDDGLVIISNGMGKMVAVNPDRDDHAKAKISWSLSRGVAKKSSPLVIGKRLFMVSDSGIASCVDITNGQTIWQERLGGKFSASPIYDGRHIFAFSESGRIHVFRPNDTFTLVKQSQLGPGFKASPAVVGKRLILRGFNHLYCIEGS